MSIHPLAGKQAPKDVLVNIPRLVADYYQYQPDPQISGQLISFSTSGHRGARTWSSRPRAAVIGVVAVVNVPIVHLSVTWMNALHQLPTVLRPDGPALDGRMLATLIAGVVAFTVLYAWLMVERTAIESARQRRLRRTRGLMDGNAPFIVAAYLIVWGSLAAYALSLRVRR